MSFKNISIILLQYAQRKVCYFMKVKNIYIYKFNQNQINFNQNFI